MTDTYNEKKIKKYGLEKYVNKLAAIDDIQEYNAELYSICDDLRKSCPYLSHVNIIDAMLSLTSVPKVLELQQKLFAAHKYDEIAHRRWAHDRSCTYDIEETLSMYKKYVSRKGICHFRLKGRIPIFDHAGYRIYPSYDILSECECY